MATPISWAQDVMICDICNTAAANRFCNSCQVKLCGNCINDHVNAIKLLLHDIVSFTDKNVKVVSQQCETHPGQRYEACCHKCDVVVCMKCVINSHKGHTIEEIPVKFFDNMKKIMEDSEELQKQLDLERLQNDAQKLNISKSTAEFEVLEEELEQHRKCWHQEVDDIFDKHKSLNKVMKKNAIKSFTEQNYVPKPVTKRKLQIIKENKDIIRAKSISKVVNYKSKLQEYKAMPKEIDATVTVPSLKVKTDRGKELDIEFGEHRATLTQTLLGSLNQDVPVSSATALLVKGRDIADIKLSTKCKYLVAIACVGSDEAWICCGSEFILRLDITGSVRESVEITNYPSDISVTQQGQMIYTEFDGKYVKIVILGVTKPLIEAPEGWKPWGLCCTNSGNILVDLVRDDSTYDHKIVRYAGQKAVQEIQNNSDGDPIFQTGNFIIYLAENKNGDICASDGNAKEVVVMDATGTVRFTYDGDQAKRKKYFCPEQIATDSMSQIIVTDHNNDCLHILDQNGHFLQCVDDCGLDTPGGLSVDSKGRCWVGLHSGKLKVISLKM